MAARSLLLCRHTPSHQPYVTQVNRHLRSFTSALVRPRAPHVTPKPFPLRRHFKPLASVGILKECNRILLAMEEVDDLGYL